VKRRGLRVGATLVACTVAGGLAGGLLSAYWWDFPPDDVETWRTATIVLYSALGAIAGLLIGGLLVGLALAAAAVRRHPSNWRNVPIWSGATGLAVIGPTFGAGIVLVPVALLLTVLAARRTSAPRGTWFWIGLVVNVLLGVLLLWATGAYLYETWIGSA
jgi:MFS family permease